MILFLYGTDDYRVQDRFHFLRDAFIQKYDNAGHNVVSINLEQFDLDEIRKHVRSVGLFSERRFVILRNIWSLDAEQKQQMEEELAAVGEDIIVCIVATEPPRKNDKLFTWLTKNAKAEEYNALSPHQLQTFIREQAKRYGATIESDATQYIAAQVGNDLWRIHNEVKILAHQSSTITKQMATEAIEAALNDNIFHLTDALGAKQEKQALSLLEQQLELGAHEQYVLTMLGRHISSLLKVKQTGGEGLQMHPYALKKNITQSQRFTEQELRSLFWRLLEIDEAMKTSKANPRALLELFVVDVCADRT